VGKKKTPGELGRRERQIMDVIYQLGQASVGDVHERLEDPPSYSSVRTMIRHLEGKGFLKHFREGNKYIYQPTQSRDAAGRWAIRQLLKTFFKGSPSDAVAAILDLNSDKLTDEDLDRLEELIDKTRQEGNE
jgi:predicted transcriptional regulator